MTTTKYPVEVASVVRSNKTLGINSFLFRANASDNESPYKIYGKFSRYAITLFERVNGQRKMAKGNIRVGEFADIERRTQYAFNKHMSMETGGAEHSNSLPSAYTVKIATGALKGKSPAQAIIDGQGAMVVEQRKFLQANLQKYPSNKIQIDAITEAIGLYRENKLDPSLLNSSVDNEVISLYNAGIHPLVREKRADGKCFVYDISIVWKLGAKYPVNFNITNYYANVKKMDDGRLNVGTVDESSRIKLSIAMSEAEWFDILASIERNMNQFEVITAKMIFDEADETYNAIINQSKNDNKQEKVETVQYYSQPQVQQSMQQPIQSQSNQYQQSNAQQTNPYLLSNQPILDIATDDLPF